VNANAQDKYKKTLLYIVSNRRRLAVARVLQAGVARFLIDQGADANALDIRCQTPLHIASECGSVKVDRVLLEHGVDANARDDGQQRDSFTPSILLGELEFWKDRCLDVVQLPLQYSPDSYAQDNEGQSPFMIATVERDHEHDSITVRARSRGPQDMTTDSVRDIC
jgi:ankyrin repeat protein